MLFLYQDVKTEQIMQYSQFPLRKIKTFLRPALILLRTEHTELDLPLSRELTSSVHLALTPTSSSEPLDTMKAPVVHRLLSHQVYPTWNRSYLPQ